MTGRIFSINIGEHKGEAKKMVREAILKKDFGIVGDAHAGSRLRQVSLLAIEDMEKAEVSQAIDPIEFHPGIFAENITTEGIDLSGLQVGDRLKVGEDVVLCVEQIGKSCHTPCRIGQSLGDCLMPKQGIFASVQSDGNIKVYDKILVEKTNMNFKMRSSFLSWSKT